MSKLIAGMALFLAASLSGSSAQAGSWCAFYDSSTYNCGFHSFQQCYATVYGNAGWCRPNFFEGGQGRKSGRRTRDSRN
jgi:Protein of unknown function (DUF3551)